MEKIDFLELCFIKMLLIKYGNIFNRMVTIDDIELTIGIERMYFIKPLHHLFQTQVISFSNIDMEGDHNAETKEEYLASLKTMEEYLALVEQNIATKITVHTRFAIEMSRDKLNQLIDNYLSQYRENKFKDKKKLDFKTQEKIIRSLIADKVSNKVTELTEFEKNSPFGIEIIISGNSINYDQLDLLEILLIIEKDCLIKITALGIGFKIDATNKNNIRSIDYCSSANLLVANYQQNQILQSNNSDGAISYRFFDYDKPHGWLKIGNYPEISFSKMPALIVFYFYEANKIDKTHKNYQDFNSYYLKYGHSVTSDEFNKKIKLINKKINRETRGMVKETITRGENKKLDANIYRWISNLP